MKHLIPFFLWVVVCFPSSGGQYLCIDQGEPERVQAQRNAQYELERQTRMLQEQRDWQAIENMQRYQERMDREYDRRYRP
jgi:hypothetical protein